MPSVFGDGKPSVTGVGGDRLWCRNIRDCKAFLNAHSLVSLGGNMNYRFIFYQRNIIAIIQFELIVTLQYLGYVRTTVISVYDTMGCACLRINSPIFWLERPFKRLIGFHHRIFQIRKRYHYFAPLSFLDNIKRENLCFCKLS